MKIENHNLAPFSCIVAHPNLFEKNYLGWVINYLLMNVLPDRSMQYILIGNMEVFGVGPAIMVKIMVSDGDKAASC